MAFQAMMSGSECSASNNALGQFMKHAQGDRSLQQDVQAGPHPLGGGRPMGSGFRSAGLAGPAGSAAGPAGSAAAAPQRPGQASSHPRDVLAPGGPALATGSGIGSAFDLHQLKDPLVQIRSGSGTGTSSPHAGHADMEAAFRRSQLPIHPPPPPPLPTSVESIPPGWQEQFQRFQSTGSLSAHPAASSPFSQQQNPGRTQMGMGAALRPGMGSMGTMQPPMMSSHLHSLDQASFQPRHQESEEQRLTQLSDERWEAEFAKLDEQVKEAAPAHEQGKGKEKAQGPPQAEPSLSTSSRESEDAVTNATEHQPDTQVTREGAESLLNQFRPDEPDFFPQDAVEDGFFPESDTMDTMGYPQLGEYEMQASNPFLTHPDPISEGLQLLTHGGSLSDATLLFEAAAQRTAPANGDGTTWESSEAWRRLGEAHSMNEMEEQAIRALEKSLEIDSNNLETYIPLAVAYTNEGYDVPAWQALKSYVTTAYPHLISTTATDAMSAHTDPWSILNEVTDLFLQAARIGAGKGIVDPEIQIGLGVLFFSNQSYAEAKDCFSAALSVRPNDFLLWNRLGAVLANSGNSEEAIAAYGRALELRPTYTRAMYNLSVSCLNLGAPGAAAEHLLAAIAVQRNTVIGHAPRDHDVPSGATLTDAQESPNLWSTLRRIFTSMDRMDLANKARPGASLDDFKKQLEA